MILYAFCHAILKLIIFFINFIYVLFLILSILGPNSIIGWGQIHNRSCNYIEWGRRISGNTNILFKGTFWLFRYVQQTYHLKPKIKYIIDSIVYLQVKKAIPASSWNLMMVAWIKTRGELTQSLASRVWIIWENILGPYWTHSRDKQDWISNSHNLLMNSFYTTLCKVPLLIVKFFICCDMIAYIKIFK